MKSATYGHHHTCICKCPCVKRNYPSPISICPNDPVANTHSHNPPTMHQQAHSPTFISTIPHNASAVTIPTMHQQVWIIQYCSLFTTQVFSFMHTQHAMNSLFHSLVSIYVENIENILLVYMHCKNGQWFCFSDTLFSPDSGLSRFSFFQTVISPDSVLSRLSYLQTVISPDSVISR